MTDARVFPEHSSLGLDGGVGEVSLVVAPVMGPSNHGLFHREELLNTKAGSGGVLQRANALSLPQSVTRRCGR